MGKDKKVAFPLSFLLAGKVLTSALSRGKQMGVTTPNKHTKGNHMTEPQDWEAIRARYELGEEPVKEIAASVGLKPFALALQAKALGWMLRRQSPVKTLLAAKSGKPQSTQATLKRLKELLQSRIVNLERQLADIGDKVNAIKTERDLRSVNTLVRTLDKVLELENKNRSSRTKANREFKLFDDAERGALADKLERLQRKYEAEEADAGTSAGRGGGTESPVALLGEAGPADSAGGPSENRQL
jgi:hypothetical protein